MSSRGELFFLDLAKGLTSLTSASAVFTGMHLISIKGIKRVAIIRVLWRIIITFIFMVNSILVVESTI